MPFTRGQATGSKRPSAAAVRYRVRVARLGDARELTHLGQIERLRRAVSDSGLPAVTQRRRKRSRPKLAFGPAIAMGYESDAEYFDMELSRGVAPLEIGKSLDKALGDGLVVRSVRRIPLFYPSLEASINVVKYEIRGPFPQDAPGALEKFLARDEIIIEKLKEGGARVERVDARPLIITMRLAKDHLELTLRFGPKRTVKPEALLRACLETDPSGFRILRKELFSETSRGELLEP